MGSNGALAAERRAARSAQQREGFEDEKAEVSVTEAKDAPKNIGERLRGGDHSTQTGYGYKRK